MIVTKLAHAAYHEGLSKLHDFFQVSIIADSLESL